MKIQVIACDKSGYPVVIKYKNSDTAQHKFVGIKKVPCLGAVKENDILEALEGECDRVLLVGCPLDSCFHREGSRFAQRRVNKINQLLEEAQIPKRVFISFVTVDKISALQRTLEIMTATPSHEEQKP